MMKFSYFHVLNLTQFHFSAMKGDEAALQRALGMVYGNKHDYVALLFYASWCPFSASFRPTFSILASLFPSVPHFAVEESAVKPRLEYFEFCLLD